MRSRQVVLAIGSNLGDRFGYLQGAINKLCDFGMKVIAVSPVYETAPWGPVSQDDYLNCVVIVETSQSLREVMNDGQLIEHFYQRTRDIKWGPRTLDIDVIAAGRECSSEPDLVIPHPYAHLRAFVIVPWLDVQPDADILGQGSLAHIIRNIDASSVHLRSDLVIEVP